MRLQSAEELTLPETIKLPARLDIAAAQSLHQDISNLDLSEGVKLDATDVAHMGTLGVQVILAAARAAKDAGASVEIENVSERSEEQLASLGLSADALMEGAR